jgi:hypothetical protein
LLIDTIFDLVVNRKGGLSATFLLVGVLIVSSSIG